MNNQVKKQVYGIGIGACKKYPDRRALSTTSSEDICQLTKSILENNVLSFSDEYFLQVCGSHGYQNGAMLR